MLYKLSKNQDLGLLLIRLALASVFIYHGAAKFQNIAGTETFFAKLGLGIFFVYLVAAVELLGGIAMLAGLFTEYAGILLTINMAFAVYLVKFPLGFSGGYEFDLTLLLVSLGIALVGPGKYTLQYLRSEMSNS